MTEELAEIIGNKPSTEDEIFEVWEELEKEKKKAIEELGENVKNGIFPENINDYLIKIRNDKKSSKEYKERVSEIVKLVNEEIKQKFNTLKNMRSKENSGATAKRKGVSRRLNKEARAMKGADAFGGEPLPRVAVGFKESQVIESKKEPEKKVPGPGEPYVSGDSESEAIKHETVDVIREKSDVPVPVYDISEIKKVGIEPSPETPVVEEKKETISLGKSSLENNNGLSKEQAFKNTLNYISSLANHVKNHIDKDFKEGKKSQERYIVPANKEIRWDLFEGEQAKTIEENIAKVQQEVDDYLKAKKEEVAEKESEKQEEAKNEPGENKKQVFTQKDHDRAESAPESNGHIYAGKSISDDSKDEYEKRRNLEEIEKRKREEKELIPVGDFEKIVEFSKKMKDELRDEYEKAGLYEGNSEKIIESALRADIGANLEKNIAKKYKLKGEELEKVVEEILNRVFAK